MRRPITFSFLALFLLLPISAQLAETLLPRSFTVGPVAGASGQVLIIVDTSNLASNIYLENVQVTLGFYDENKRRVSSEMLRLGNLFGGQKEARIVKEYATPEPSARYMRGDELQVWGSDVEGGKADRVVPMIAGGSGFIGISSKGANSGIKELPAKRPQQTKELTRLVPGVPQLISPSDGTVFEDRSIKPVLTWAEVAGASRYGIEIDCFHCCVVGRWCSDVGGKTTLIADLIKTQYVFDANPQPYRWRVWAVGAGGAESAKSSWWTLSYK